MMLRRENTEEKVESMFSWDFGLPMLIVVALILFSWFSFLSVAFFG